ncbi:MarR family winged helix-turn-helix transcriptional regulator [Streptomyces sp. NBC_01497]|uniref:MarR family winged helix-turn-helix transcriptional regulator n=1 Tax=Streptomyces sp. NBC_01497 TaxID=2903885 RepID=UPI002E335EB5|nr:MarR family transcriptional regulator [Streptomyces sp. NBC_01497]
MPDDAARGTRSARPRPAGPAHAEPAGSAAPAEAARVVDLGIVDSLAQLSFVVQSALGKVATDHGLSVIQLRLLGVLRDREPGMQELARHLGLDKSSMTGLVDRAERRGLVRRDPSPHDGRAVQVSLTEEGHILARVLTVEADRRVLALTAGLTEEQCSRLSLLASTLVSGLSAI